MTTLMAKREPTVQLRDHERLNARRKAKKYTLATLAEAVGVHKSMIGHLCSGHTITCSQTLGRAIEDALGLKEGSLFKRPDYDLLLERRGSRARKDVEPGKPVEQVIEEEK
jgi:transcriptional regulator with XRE-family HTH domain